MSNYLLFVKADGCPECAKVKQELAEAGFSGVEQIKGVGTVLVTKGDMNVVCYDLDTVDGLAEASFHNVRTVPTLIIRHEDSSARHHGVEDVLLALGDNETV